MTKTTRTSTGSSTSVRTNPRKRKPSDSSTSGNNDIKKKHVCISKALSWLLRHGAPSLGMKMSCDGYVPVDAILMSSHPRFVNLVKTHHVTIEDIQVVVETNEKQRFRLSTLPIQILLQQSDKKPSSSSFPPYTFVNTNVDDSQHDENDNDKGMIVMKKDVLCIRANQGHSIPNILCDESSSLRRVSRDELKQMLTLVHGTYYTAWESIANDGYLSRMKRNHIHLAKDLPSSNAVKSGMRQSSQVHIYIDTQKCATDYDKLPFFKSDNDVILTPGINGKLPMDYFLKVIDAKTGQQLLP